MLWIIFETNLSVVTVISSLLFLSVLNVTRQTDAACQVTLQTGINSSVLYWKILNYRERHQTGSYECF